MAEAVDILRDALFGNPPSSKLKPSREGVLAAFTALEKQATVAIAGAIAGIVYYATGAERAADTANQPIGKLAKAANEADYYRREGAGWVVDNTVYEGIAQAAQSLIDESAATINVRINPIAASLADWVKPDYVVQPGFYEYAGGGYSGPSVTAWNSINCALPAGTGRRGRASALVQGGPTALAFFVNDAGTVVPPAIAPAGAGSTQYTDYEFAIPDAATFVRITGFATQPVKLELLQLADGVAIKAGAAFESIQTWQDVGGTTVEGAFLNKDAGGAANPIDGYHYRRHVIQPGETQFRASAVENGGAAALAAYYNAGGALIGFQGPGTGTEMLLTQNLILPAGTVEIGVSGLSKAPLVLEARKPDANLGDKVQALAAGGRFGAAEVYVGNPLGDTPPLTADSVVTHYFADPKHAVILVGGGQSNELAHSDDPNDPLYGTAAIYPDNALMFSGGVHRADGMKGDQTLVPMIEAPWRVARSTSMSSWANHTIQLVEARVGIRPTVAGFIAAIGGTPLVNLGPGGKPDAWKAFEDGLVDMVAALMGRGFERFTIVYRWTQGEAESGTQRRMTRRRALRNLFAFVTEACERIAGTKPFILNNQICSVRQITDKWAQTIRQVPVDMDLAGESVLAGPFYAYPQSQPAAGTYEIHMSCKAHNYYGQMCARATVSAVFEQGHRSIVPVGYRWRSAMVLDVEFDSPASLMLDTSNAMVKTSGLVNGTGIEFDDGSGSPPAFTAAVADRVLTLTFAAAPTGPSARVGYALTPNNVEHDGPVTGARGILRDTTDHVNLYDGTHQANWANGFVLPVPKG